MPPVVHYWADLQSVHGLHCYGNTVEINAWQNPAVTRQAHRTPHARRTRTLRMLAKTPLASDKIDVSAACAVPFRPYCGGVVTRTRNLSEYMLVLALCLVSYSISIMISSTVEHVLKPLSLQVLGVHEQRHRERKRQRDRERERQRDRERARRHGRRDHSTWE